MLPAKFSLIAVISLTVLVTYCLGDGKTHDERCQIIEGNGVRVDECDGSKFLSCRDGRCQCPDPANQAWTYRNEPVNSRSRRSPGKKGSGFKKVAAGAVVGAATYHVVSQAGKGVSNGFTTTPKPPKYQRVYSCYSRVGGQCVLNTNNWETIDIATTSTTTTTPAPGVTEVSNATLSSDNSTTTPAPSTEAPPQAAAQVGKLDLTKIPRCVQYAVCNPGHPTTPSTNGTSSASVGFHQKVDHDPRLGVCECAPGYKKTSRDFCEKDGSGAGRTVTGASFAVIMATLVISRMF